jgi:hypothetical protein
MLAFVAVVAFVSGAIVGAGVLFAFTVWITKDAEQTARVMREEYRHEH